MVSVSSRPQRIVQGGPRIFSVLLGITQQVALIPVFLHFWTSDTLAAWLVLYAAGNLVLVAGRRPSLAHHEQVPRLQSSVDSTAHRQYYVAMLQIYLVAPSACRVLCSPIAVARPSRTLGFQAVQGFDIAFVVMTSGCC